MHRGCHQNARRHVAPSFEDQIEAGVMRTRPLRERNLVPYTPAIGAGRRSEDEGGGSKDHKHRKRGAPLGNMFYDGWEGIARTLVVGFLTYAGLVVTLRWSGKRTLSKMNALDLIVTVALGLHEGDDFTSFHRDSHEFTRADYGLSCSHAGRWHRRVAKPGDPPDGSAHSRTGAAIESVIAARTPGSSRCHAAGCALGVPRRFRVQPLLDQG